MGIGEVDIYSFSKPVLRWDIPKSLKNISAQEFTRN
jgi:hypothetical protein